MPSEITTVRKRKPYGREAIKNGFCLFIDGKSDALDIGDSLFHEHKIWSIRQKVKTYRRIQTQCTKELIADLRTIPGFENLDIRWSRTAGCSCGCSPGFRVKGLTSDSVAYKLNNSDVWVKSKLKPIKLSNLKAKIESKYLNSLKEELNTIAQNRYC